MKLVAVCYVYIAFNLLFVPPFEAFRIVSHRILPTKFELSNDRLTKVFERSSISMSSDSSSPSMALKKAPRKPSSLGPLVVNLMKNCVGAGVFSIHSRVATATGSLPLPYVGALVYLMASWATYNFYIIGETCKLTNSSTYSEAWSKSISQKTQWIVQSVVILAPIVSCLANVIVLTDILGVLLKSLGLPVMIYANRNLVITLLSAVVLFPLCIQSNLSGLKSVSTLGLAGHIVAMGALAIRLLDKSYLPGGQFYKALQALPAIVNSPAINAAAALSIAKWSTLASLLSYCYVTHYNAPRYYSELEGKEKYPHLQGLLPLLAYSGAAHIYIGTALLTLALFGARAPVFALNGFSSADGLGTLARVAFGTSVLASFPLIFFTMRNWFVTQASKHVPALGNVKSMTVVLLTFIGLIATRCDDIGLVGSIAGGVFGSSMMFIFPPLIYIATLFRRSKDEKSRKLPVTTIALNAVLLVLGSCLGAFGTFNSIMSVLKR